MEITPKFQTYDFSEKKKNKKLEDLSNPGPPMCPKGSDQLELSMDCPLSPAPHLGNSELSNLPQSSPLIFTPKPLFPSCHLPACCNECKLCHKGLVNKHAPPRTRRLTHARPGHRALRAPSITPGSILCSVQAPPQLCCFSICQPHSSRPDSPVGT